MRSQASFNELGKRQLGRPAEQGTDRRGSEALRGLSRSSTARSVVVHVASDELRRALGPTSWMVLEELSLSSTGTADNCTARVSIRALAEALGLAKDTVARAVRRLRDAGLVTVAQRRTNAGVFDTGTYLIARSDSVTLVASVPTAIQPRARSIDATPCNSRSRSSPEEPPTMATRTTEPMNDRQVPARGGVWSCCG